MKIHIKTVILLGFCLFTGLGVQAQEKKIIQIGTQELDLVLQVSEKGRLYQTYFGEKLRNPEEYANQEWWVNASSDGSVVRRGWEVYSGSGNEDFFEPAIAVQHNDGNRTTYLEYVSSESKPVAGGTETLINLRDKVYPVEVTLHYIAYEKENVIKTWSEIKHQEKKPVVLSRYASTMLYFERGSYYLTEFSSDWAREVQMSKQQLQPGKKILDSKLGSRANLMMDPLFEIGMDQPAQEHQGEVLLGTLGWTGNFSFTFEVDNVGNLRVIPSINPYESAYQLAANTTFTTPEFIFTLSQEGTGKASRNLHAWARKYQLKDGDKPRMTLLNNWENTYFFFDEAKLGSLMKEAKDFGVDMFLLDDGWFGNGEHARNHDRAGLGDWEVNHKKLPGGVPALIKLAKEAGVKFGIWIEPEMVNPKSDLFEKHPDWAICYPNREPYYFRNQLVLDMSNPKVQDYVYGVVDKLMKENPEIAYFKWDCNSPITNIWSPYLKENQSQLYIDHVRGVYNVFKRVKESHPNLPMMLCAGGGGRGDYEALKYFTEFWCSDDTDPIERCYIQWGFSQFFPAKAMCAHVTSWNRNTSIKFRTDVASMCKLGFDIGLKDLSEKDLTYCKEAIQNWNRLQPVILDGEQYRLVSPYETNHMAVNYVSQDKKQAVLFAYNIHPRLYEKLLRVKLQGLDPAKRYKVVEINLMPGTRSSLAENGKTYSGDYLMKIGLGALKAQETTSSVIELIAE